MTWTPSPFVKQFVALSVLFLSVGIALSLGEKMVIEPLLSRGADIAALSEQLTEIRSTQRGEKTLSKRRVEIENRLDSLGIYWSGPTRPQIAASMQDVLRVAARQSDGQIVSTSVLEEASKDKTISVRARIDGTLVTVQHVLSAIEQSRPRLFVTSLVVTAVAGANTPARAQPLSFELSVVGYVSSQ